MADKNNGLNDSGESPQEKGERSKSGKNKRRGKNRGPHAGSSESTSSSAADPTKSTSEQGVSNPSFHDLGEGLINVDNVKYLHY